MASTPLRRLKRVEVDGLFGIYRHCIDLALDDRVTLLHGPNGVGKTTVLKMVDALLTGKVSYFRRVPFARLMLGFHDGTKIELTKEGHRRDADRAVANVRLSGNGANKATSIELTPSRAEAIAVEHDFLQRVGEDAWMDIRDGAWLTDSEVVRRYSSSYRPYWARAAKPDGRHKPWLREFFEAANSHFIEAQRLVRSHHHARGLRSPPDVVMSRVVECGRELKTKIDDTMAEYGRQAQTMDQTFPQRLLHRSASSGSLSVEAIRTRMADLESKTEDLKDIGILEGTDPFEVGDKIDDSQAGVMTLYVEDTERKLQVLEDLASRAQLLLKSLNGKFRHKQIRVDRDEGLAVEGEHELLPLDSLSSGEQHELILHYDLLFRVQPNTVVLLDEPELSLHIEWQSKFLSDLMAIVKLSGFDALVATHSPHIVGDRDDLMVELAG